MTKTAFNTKSPPRLVLSAALGVLLASSGICVGQDQFLQYHGDGWVELPDGVTPAVDLTIEMWQRADDLDDGADIHMMYFWGPRIGCSPSSQLIFVSDAAWAPAGFRPHFLIGCASASALNGLDETQPGVWQHIAITIAGDGFATLYVNGFEQESGFPNGGQSVGTGNDLLGARWSGNDFLPSEAGALDEVRLWDHVRSQAEIQDNMNETLTGLEDGLLAYWNFDDGAADDVTPNAFDGVLMGDAEIVGDDSDGDGIPDDLDDCPASDLADTVVIDGCDSGVTNYLLDSGCTISDLIMQCAAEADNHGDFVSCVAHLTNDLKKAGVITGQEKGAIQSCAAQANIP